MILKHDGCVNTWGHYLFGGDSSTVSDQVADGVEMVIGNEVADGDLPQ